MAEVPERPKADNEGYSEASQIIIKQGQDQKDAQAIDRFQVPKLVTSGNFELVGRHPNKAAFIMFGDNSDYPTKAELNLVVGAFGAVKTEVDPKTKKASKYKYPNPADGVSLVLSEATNDTGIVSTVGKPNFRGAIKAKADTIKIHAREVLELAAGGENYISNTAKNPSAYGAVHIIAGNRIGKKGTDFSLEPLVKGTALAKFLKQQVEFIQNLTSVQQEIITDLLGLKKMLATLGTQLAGSAAPLPPAMFALVPAAGTALVAAVGVSSAKFASAVSNNLAVGNNHTLLKVNHLEDFSPKFILSKYNKVN